MTPISRKHRLHHLGAARRIGHLRRLDGEGKAVGIAGLGKQRLRLGGVKRQRARQVLISRVVRCVVAADRRAETGPGALDDRLAVERHHQGLAHPLVVEGLARIVHAGNDLELGIADLGHQPRIAVERAHQLGCCEFGKCVEVAGLQGGRFRLRIGDEAEGHFIELHVDGFVPVIRVLYELHMVALGPGREFERAGADRRRLVVGGRIRTDHHGRGPAEPIEQTAGW